MFSLFDFIYDYKSFQFEIPATRGKGHFKKAHKNNYKQKIKNRRGKRR